MTTSAESSLNLTRPSASEIRIERTFNAPRHLVWEAHTKPEYIRQWLLGPEGWSMPVCEYDAREGGAFRYEWVRDETGERMGMSGTIFEFAPIDRIVADERFDDPWYPGQCVNTSLFEDVTLPGGSGTRLTVTSRWDNEEAVKIASATGMLDGMAETYDRLADVLGTLAGAPGLPEISVEVVELPEQRVARLRGALGDAQGQWGRAMGAAAPVLGVPGVFRASILPAEAVAGGGVGPQTRYDTAVILPAGIEVPAGLEADVIPPGRYARASYVGGFEGLGGAWTRFVDRWLPTSGERVAVGASDVAFEIYREDGPPPVTELHLPLA
ncbi:MAG: SRPBCC domain-containing protein [Dehalococcoidia bacterium]